ncbi:MAG TPA: hypothetical protein VF762_10700, partial [Blastocatellia bacterium]
VFRILLQSFLPHCGLILYTFTLSIVNLCVTVLTISPDAPAVGVSVFSPPLASPSPRLCVRL